jgi:hypothetical protein
MLKMLTAFLSVVKSQWRIILMAKGDEDNAAYDGR